MTDFPATADVSLEPNNISFVVSSDRNMAEDRTSTTTKACSSTTDGSTVRESSRYILSATVSHCSAVLTAGLSYTTFKMTNLEAAVAGTIAADAVASSSTLYDVVAWVSVDVCNTGAIFGTEIAQAYIGSPAEGAAPRVLRGFEAVHLGPGETKRITFELTRRDLRWVLRWKFIDHSYWNVLIAGWTLPQGVHHIYVGNSSRNVQQSANVTLSLI